MKVTRQACLTFPFLHPTSGLPCIDMDKLHCKDLYETRDIRHATEISIPITSPQILLAETFDCNERKSKWLFTPPEPSPSRPQRFRYPFQKWKANKSIISRRHDILFAKELSPISDGAPMLLQPHHDRRRTPWSAEEHVGLHPAIESIDIDRENWNDMGSTTCNIGSFLGRQSSRRLHRFHLGSVALGWASPSECQRSKTWYLGSSRGCSICNRLEKIFSFQPKRVLSRVRSQAEPCSR